MKKHEIHLHISVGLPGSGKTTLFKQLAEGSRDNYLIECDKYLIGNNPIKVEELINNKSYLFKNNTFIDGLFLKKENISKVLKLIEKEGIKIKKLTIHYWNPDIDACKWNDKGRREKDSKITIENAEIDSLNDIMKISEEFKEIKFDSKNHKIIKKPDWKVFAEQNKLYIDDNGILKGESWCLGGTSGNCWDDKLTPISPSAAPESFRELDDLLENVAPNISFLQYKKIINECVSTNEYSDGDYYGGRTYHNQQFLDVKALYYYLVDKELIQPCK